jgi:hypothetical protein
VNGCDSVSFPSTYEAVIEDAPQLQPALPDERRIADDPAEAAQAAVANSAPATAMTFRPCVRRC